MSLNIKLLRKVQRAILREPKRYAQQAYTKENLSIEDQSQYVCNTVGCIAGWAVAIDRGLLDNLGELSTIPISLEAENLLGLRNYENYRLFHTRDWPNAFSFFLSRYQSEALRGPHWLQALVAAIRIEVFIRSKGAR